MTLGCLENGVFLVLTYSFLCFPFGGLLELLVIQVGVHNFVGKSKYKSNAEARFWWR